VIELLENDPRPFLTRPDAVDDLRTYYGTYEGRFFDSFGRDRSGVSSASANHFDAVDILAVQALNVTIPTSTAARLIEDAHENVFRNLAILPTHVELWDDDALAYVEDGGPAEDLWSSLMGYEEIGWAVAHKLCARKRPNLLPVYDVVVKAALQPTRSSYWLPLRATLREHHLVPVLEELRSRAGLDRVVPLLRVFNVAVWMEARR
jgi:hypothetical protein